MQDPQGKSISIVIADDHPIVRKGLREILEDERAFRVVGECENGTDALECIREQEPDVTITDSAEMFNQAMEYGVTGYVLKDAAVTDLVQGVRKVLRGEYFFSASMASKALLEQRNRDNVPALPSRFSELTPTERKILRFIAEDKSTSEIAE